MDKSKRQEITNRKHIKRCKILGLKPNKHYEYKNQAKPCSCSVCSPVKYSRKIKHKDLLIN